MSPAEEGIEDFDIHAARLFEEETAIWFENACNFINRSAPVGDVMQNAEDDNHVLAFVLKLT